MQIARDTVACFQFTLTDASGEIIEANTSDTPTAYLHGAGNLFPALER